MLSSAAVSLPRLGSYTIAFAPSASRAIARLPPASLEEIRQRLHEIASVAEFFASPAADGVQSTLRLEFTGCVVSYVISDAQRMLTVLSVVPAEPS